MMTSSTSGTACCYDLFLSYNSADHSFVEDIAHRLRDAGLEPFLDRWYLTPGARWRPKLEEILTSSKAVAICVGAGQMGSWQQREADVALDLQSKSPDFPVIPVLLPGSEPPLGFLGQLMWVDFRSQLLDQAIAILTKAARREPPGPDLQRRLESVRASICPYRGLLYFREEDAPLFFGREKDVGTLSDAIRQLSFLAVVGASGSGKSSVVRAGLVPRLRSDRSATWEIVTLVPTDQPLKAMAGALVPLLEPMMSEVDRLVEVGKLAEHFRSETVSFADVLRRICSKQSGTDRVLVVVDQFEELFTLTHDDVARRRFIDELLAVGSCSESKLSVVLTLRGDFVGRTLAYRPLSDRLQGAQINIGPMTREELQCAILKPAEKVQLEFEPGLVRRILNDVGDEPGNLPLLEFVLKELWEKRRGRVLLNETYDAIGGLQGAVATKADELLKGLSLAEQKILQRVFLRIVRPSESGTDTRRRATFSELPPEGAELVFKLANQRLLVTNKVTDKADSGLEQTVEVAHEALISNWGTLRAWVKEDREFLLWRERLDTLLKEWERAEKNIDALLRGPLLIEAQKWFDQRSQDLSDQERKFIFASRSLREQLAREERERRERDLEAAQRLACAEADRAEEAEERAKEQKRAASNFRRLSWILAAAALTAMAAGGVAVVELNSARRAENSARAADERTRTGANYLARNLQEAGRKAEALAYLAQALRPNQNDEAAALIVTMLPQTSWPVPVGGLMRHDSAIESVQFSPNGQQVVTASADGTVRLWDVASGEQRGQPMKHEKGVHSARFSPDGQRVVTASMDGTARLWDTVTGKQLGELMQHEGEVISAQFSPDGQRVVTASYDGTARLWDAASGKPIGKPMKHGRAVHSAQFSPDGQRVVTASEDQTARLWDAASGEALGKPMQHGGLVHSAQFSPDGQRVVTASWDATARLWDAASGEQRGQPMAHDRYGYVHSVQFSPDGQRVVTASEDKTARLWDAASGEALGKPMQHGGLVSSAQFSPDGQRVVTASYDGTARVWDAASGEPLGEPMQHGGLVISAQFSLDGQRVVTASTDGTGRLWDVASNKAIEERMQHRASVESAHFSPDGQRVVTASWDWTAQVWDALSGKAIGERMQHRGTLYSAQFSPDGQRVLTASEDGTAQLWDALSGKAIGGPMRHQRAVRSAQFSPDGQRVVTASYDGTARLWDTLSGKAIGEPMRHEREVFSAQFSADGQRVVTASEDGTARLWDALSGKAIGQRMQHRGRVQSAQFSADGQRVVTASWDGTARLWDALSGKASGEPMRHERAVYSAQFSRDGKWVVTASHDGMVQLWDALSGKAIGKSMRHERAVFSAQFSPDGTWVVTASEDGTVWLWDRASGKKMGTPMKHDGGWPVHSAEFSPDGQRVLTASGDMTARLWDVPTISSKDAPEDMRLLTDLAGATSCIALQVSGNSEIWNVLAPEQVRATRQKIAARFDNQSSKLTPLQRLLKWSVSGGKIRTISPLSELTLEEWIENRITEGTPEGLRAAMHMDPANARLAAYFGRLLAARLEFGFATDPGDARRTGGEADFQTRRALKLAPDNDEVKKLRAEVVELLHMTSK